MPNGDLHEEVYMSLPENYTGKGELISPTTLAKAPFKHLVCKLKKSLYGLK